MVADMAVGLGEQGLKAVGADRSFGAMQVRKGRAGTRGGRSALAGVGRAAVRCRLGEGDRAQAGGRRHVAAMRPVWHLRRMLGGKETKESKPSRD